MQSADRTVSKNTRAKTVARERRSNRHYEGIDLLRFLAAGGVVLFHYSIRGAAEGHYTTFQLPDLAWIAQYGYLGVELFFIISGFVITGATQKYDATSFLRSRFLRLYPAFAACMTLTAVVSWTAAGGTSRGHICFTDWLANLLLFAPAFGSPFVDGVYWSLVLEVVFYAWVGFFMFCGWFERRRLLIVAVWLVVALGINGATSSKMLHTLFLSDYASLFATGVIFSEIATRRILLRVLPLLALAFTLSILGVVDRASAVRLLLHAPLDDGTVVAVLIGMHLAMLAVLRIPEGRRLRIVGNLGALSYPLYLLHQEIGYRLLTGLNDALGPWPAAGLTTGLVLVVSLVISTRVEPRLRQWLAQAIDRMSAAVRTATAARHARTTRSRKPRAGLAQWRPAAARAAARPGSRTRRYSSAA